MGKLVQQEFQQRMGRVEALIQRLETCPDPAIQADARELIHALLDLHAAGLERILAIVDQSGAAGEAMIEQVAQDDLAGSLLILHDLHPFDLETRVRLALEKVRPYLYSHGGNVDLLGVTEEGVVRLRLEGSCHGCPSSKITLKYAIEEGIYGAAPDVTAIEVEGAVESEPANMAGFVPLAELMG